MPFITSLQYAAPDNWLESKFWLNIWIWWLMKDTYRSLDFQFLYAFTTESTNLNLFLQMKKQDCNLQLFQCVLIEQIEGFWSAWLLHGPLKSTTLFHSTENGWTPLWQVWFKIKREIASLIELTGELAQQIITIKTPMLSLKRNLILWVPRPRKMISTKHSLISEARP